MSQRTRRVLESIMAGQQLTAADLDQLLADQVAEDLFVEYKHGNETTKRNAPATVRQYLAGFANSAGGVLIIGVDEVTWHVTGTRVPGGGSLAAWAARCLTPIAPSFSPLPRFQEVAHANGTVLVAATDRSLTLVPCVEHGALVYYLRLHDQTLAAPEYLLSDLLLGRRNRPDLQITDLHFHSISTNVTTKPDGVSLQFGLAVTIENSALAWAEDARVGIVSWRADPIYTGNFLSQHLRSYLDIRTITDATLASQTVLAMYMQRLGSIGAFDSVVRKTLSSHALPLRVHTTWYTYRWEAALFIISSEMPPQWYQLTVEVAQAIWKNASRELTSESSLITYSRLSSTRPVVALTGLVPT